MKFATPTNSRLPGGSAGEKACAAIVAQTSKSAVSRISKSADPDIFNLCRLGSRRHSRFGNRRYICHESAFTLAEVLAALLFLAIVIPAAVEALHLASLAGVVAARKGAAARVADRILNESIVLTNWNTGTLSGTVTEGAQEFRWTLTSRTWPVDAMELITAEVKYSAQGRDYSVKLCTLANSQTLATTTGSQR
jgi:type II secretory pathway pseudopilin PulG